MAPGPVTEDFPRGGASVLTPLELKEVNLKAKEDVLFKVRCLIPFSLFLFIFLIQLNELDPFHRVLFLIINEFIH